MRNLTGKNGLKNALMNGWEIRGEKLNKMLKYFHTKFKTYRNLTLGQSYYLFYESN
jgi:hypothetical protein